MKKLCLAAAAFSCLLAACDNMKKSDSASGNETTVQRNLDAVDGVNHAFETGDVSKIDSFVAADFVDHTDRGEVKSADSLKAGIRMMHASMKDMKFEQMKKVADKDYVFEQMHYSGTGDGQMMPAGHYDMHSVEVIRFNNDGKAVEHWSYMDPTEMMKMMSQMHSAPQAGMDKKMPADSMMKH